MGVANFPKLLETHLREENKMFSKLRQKEIKTTAAKESLRHTRFDLTSQLFSNLISFLTENCIYKLSKLPLLSNQILPGQHPLSFPNHHNILNPMKFIHKLINTKIYSYEHVKSYKYDNQESFKNGTLKS